MKSDRLPKSFRLLWCFVWLLAVANVCRATSVVIPTDDELIIGARAIVRGQVKKVVSGYDEAHKGIFTYITLQVSEVLKGKLGNGEIVLKEPGGQFRDYGSVIFGTPVFTVGEEVLLYLDTWPDGSLRVYQWYLGKFNLSGDQATGNLKLARATPAEPLTILGRARGGQITEATEYETYRQMVRARVQALQAESAAHEQRYFSGAPLRQSPEEYAGAETGNGNFLYFTILNPSQPMRWFEPDNGQPVVFKANLTGAYNAQALDDLKAAVSAWSTLPGTSLRLSLSDVTSGCGLTRADGENTISFNNCDNYLPFSPLPRQNCSGVLAAAGIVRFSLTETRVLNGVTFFRALEANLSFNPFARCYFTDSCNVREVATHEIGHALGLGHSADASATMYPIIHFDNRCAGLKSDDVEGLRSLYPGSNTTDNTNKLTIATTALSNGQVGKSYTQTLSATNGTPPYAWSLVAGSGALPGGLTLNGGGTISGTPTASGVFSFAVQVSDVQTRSAQQAFTINIAPPPAVGSLRANPNPIKVCDGSGKGAVVLSWATTNATAIEIRAGAPNGTLIASGGSSGEFTTSKIITQETVFYLQNTSGGLPLTAANTLATTTVRLTTEGCQLKPTPANPIVAAPNPIPVCNGSGMGSTTLAWYFQNALVIEIRLGAPSGPILARVPASGTLATGQWIRDGMTIYFRNAVTKALLGNILLKHTTQGCTSNSAP